MPSISTATQLPSNTRKRTIRGKLTATLAAGVILIGASSASAATAPVQATAGDSIQARMASRVELPPRAPQQFGAVMVNPYAQTIERETATRKGSMLDNSGFSSPEILNRWLDAGIHPKQIAELTSIIALTQSPALCRTAECYNRTLDRMERTKEIWAITSQADATRFLARNSLYGLFQDGVIEAGEIIAVTDGSYVAQWIGPDSRADGLKLELAMHWGQQACAGLPTDGNETINLNKAIEELADAVNEAGMAGVSIPVGCAGNARAMQSLARTVRSIQDTIDRGTGFGQGAAGLNGRIFWTPIDTKLAAFSSDRGSEHMMRSIGKKTSYFHEYGHAIDTAMWRAAKGLNATASIHAAKRLGDTEMLLSTAKDVPVTHPALILWQQLPAQLHTVSGQHRNGWLEREEADAKGIENARMGGKRMSLNGDSKAQAAYLRNQGEWVGQAFSFHFSQYIRDPELQLPTDDIRNAPSDQEARQISKAIREQLNAIGRAWWEPQKTTPAQTMNTQPASARVKPT